MTLNEVSIVSCVIAAWSATVMLASDVPSLLFAQHSLAVIQQFIEAPRIQLGESRADLERKLGRPTRVVMQDVKNKHQSDVVDRIWRLVFAGARAEVYETGATEYLRFLSVESRGISLRLPISVGDSRSKVLAALGEPDKTRADVLEYYAEVSYSNRSLNIVSIRLRSDRVVTIQWDYWIE